MQIGKNGLIVRPEKDELARESVGLSELLACPFCGGEAEIICDNIKRYSVACLRIKNKCPVGPSGGKYTYDTPEEAVRAWNTRAS